MAAFRSMLGLASVLAGSAFSLGACSETPAEDSGAGGSGGSAVSGAAGASVGTAGASGNSSAGSAGTGGAGAGGSASGASAGGVATAGTGGGSSGSATGGAANPGAKASAGCNKPASQALETFVEAKLTAKGFERQYFVRLPKAYDPSRAYSTVIVGAACGGNGMNGIPVQDAAKENAIVVGLSPSEEVAGRDCFMTESAMSPELDFFDAVLSTVEANYCVDESRVFFGGFSSGSWLANLLGCARGDVLRGQGNAAGGPPPIPDCKGPIATIMVHDMGDGANSYDGGKATRDRIRQLNGCMDQTAPWDPAFPQCVAYQGCPAAYPLVFCTTTGKGHSDNIPISTEGFWKFWSSLPPKP